MEKSDCIFCKLGHGGDEYRKLAETPGYYVILTRCPMTRGHSLIIPKAHYTDLEEVPSTLLTDMFAEAIKLGTQLEKALTAKAYFLRVNNHLYKLESDNPEHIGHIHVHVTPRYAKEDKLMLDVVSSPEELEKVKSEILAK